MAKVFINPGHMPDIDPGAVNKTLGITEADIVRDIGTRVTNYLDMAGCEVQLLQSDNLCYDGEGECVTAAANNWPADVFVSLHCNAFKGQAQGTETWVYDLNGDSGKLGRCIQSQLVNTIGTVDRGVKQSTGLVVLKATKMPAALVEIAFIDNGQDAGILTHCKDAIARAIARGVTDYLNE